MRIDEIFDPTLYVEMLENRYVNKRVHPSLPLSILNYSELAQYQQKWNDVTLNCRGLIFNSETGEIVARGFKKFFNWDDSSQQYPPHGPVLRSPKMDGSLGILYPTPGTSDLGWRVATRGSFESDQAMYATQLLHDAFYGGEIDRKALRPDLTYLCEIIYPNNRIVVNYGDAQRLVLLDVLDTETGRADITEFDELYWVDKVERRFFPGGFSDGFVHEIPEGEEGFVVYWPGQDYRVKMKAAEYLELHRMIFSLSERSIWARLGEGESVEDICVKLPDEFHGWVKEVGEGLLTALSRKLSEVQREFKQIYRAMVPEYYKGAPLNNARKQDRKEFARLVGRSPNRAYLFMLYDDKDLTDAIWKNLKPEGGKSIKLISEDVA